MPKPFLDVPQSVADFHELGRFLYFAKRVASNALLQRSSGDEPIVIDPRSVVKLEEIVHDALDNLTSRQRTIVERYDFAGEAYSLVAQNLGISTRHFWREHREANQCIANLLAAPEPGAMMPVIVCASDLIQEQIELSRVLENNGRWEEGAGMLEEVARDVDSVERQIDIQLRLSDLYRQAERFSLARRHAEIARTLAVRLDPSQRWREIAVEAAFAQNMHWTGETNQALRQLQRCATQLRLWVHDSSGVEAVLAEVLLSCAWMNIACNELQSAARATYESRTIIASLSKVDPQLDFSSRWTYAVVEHLMSHDSARASAEYLRCYGHAVTRGLTRSALDAAASVAAAYRLDGQPKRAIRFLNSLHDTALVLAPSTATRNVLKEIVEAHIELGEFETALSYLHNLEQPTITDPVNLGTAQLLGARAHAGLGNHTAALALSQSAEATFARLGYNRSIGRALLSQIEALVALERHAQARRVLPVAVEHIQAIDDSHRLARAYDLMAVVLDDPKYARRAQKMRLQ